MDSARKMDQNSGFWIFGAVSGALNRIRVPGSVVTVASSAGSSGSTRHSDRRRGHASALCGLGRGVDKAATCHALIGLRRFACRGATRGDDGRLPWFRAHDGWMTRVRALMRGRA